MWFVDPAIQSEVLRAVMEPQTLTGMVGIKCRSSTRLCRTQGGGGSPIPLPTLRAKAKFETDPPQIDFMEDGNE